MENKFMAWNWDGGEFITLPTNDVVKAIHMAWNYEFDVYEIVGDKKELIFSGQEDNEGNSFMLEKFGMRLIDHDKFRRLQNVKTGEIYYADWESNN